MRIFAGLSMMLLFFLALSCGGARKSMKHMPALPAVEEVKEEKKIVDPVVEPPIMEVEEKLVKVNEIPPDPSRYFVIIGSFRYPDNAARYQRHITADGFTGIVLRNEAGLYRVSVMATDDISRARAEIQRIRGSYPKYHDTWLLIQRQ